MNYIVTLGFITNNKLSKCVKGTYMQHLKEEPISETLSGKKRTICIL